MFGCLRQHEAEHGLLVFRAQRGDGTDGVVALGPIATQIRVAGRRAAAAEQPAAAAGLASSQVWSAVRSRPVTAASTARRSARSPAPSGAASSRPRLVARASRHAAPQVEHGHEGVHAAPRVEPVRHGLAALEMTAVDAARRGVAAQRALEEAAAQAAALPFRAARTGPTGSRARCASRRCRSRRAAPRRPPPRTAGVGAGQMGQHRRHGVAAAGDRRSVLAREQVVEGDHDDPRRFAGVALGRTPPVRHLDRPAHDAQYLTASREVPGADDDGPSAAGRVSLDGNPAGRTPWIVQSLRAAAGARHGRLVRHRRRLRRASGARRPRLLIVARRAGRLQRARSASSGGPRRHRRDPVADLTDPAGLESVERDAAASGGPICWSTTPASPDTGRLRRSIPASPRTCCASMRWPWRASRGRSCRAWWRAAAVP